MGELRLHDGHDSGRGAAQVIAPAYARIIAVQVQRLAVGRVCWLR
jgi:hypothetical protein